VFRRFVVQLSEHPVLAGLVSTLFYLSGLFALFAMPVFVTVTLQGGVTRGLVALGSSAVALVLLALVLPHGGPSDVVPAFVLVGLLFVAAAALLRHGRSLAFVVTLAALLALAVLASYAVSVAHPLGTFEAAVRTALAHERALLLHHYPAEAKAWSRSLASLRPLYPYLPGILGLYAVLLFAVDLFLGAGLHAAAYSPGSYGRHFRAFRTGKTLALLTLAGFLLTLVVRRPLVTDALLPFVPLYLLQGLAVVHARLRPHPYARPLLALLYGLLVVAVLGGGYLVYLVFALILLGWVDNFLAVPRPADAPPSGPRAPLPPAGPTSP